LAVEVEALLVLLDFLVHLVVEVVDKILQEQVDLVAPHKWMVWLERLVLVVATTHQTQEVAVVGILLLLLAVTVVQVLMHHHGVESLL
jgi:hypothetical protein